MLRRSLWQSCTYDHHRGRTWFKKGYLPRYVFHAAYAFVEKHPRDALTTWTGTRTRPLGDYWCGCDYANTEVPSLPVIVRCLPIVRNSGSRDCKNPASAFDSSVGYRITRGHEHVKLPTSVCVFAIRRYSPKK